MSARNPRWLSLAVFASLAIVAFVPLVALLRYAGVHGVVFAGSDSPFPGDQFQYESWIRQFGSHPLAANLLDVAPSDRVFLHPMFLLSGLAFRAGLNVEVAYLLWKPVALVLVFVGTRAYIGRFLDDAWSRAAALAIGLLFVSPSPTIVSEAATLPGPAVLLWGYLPAVMSVALMPVFLLGIERLVRTAPPDSRLGRPRDLLLVSLSGAMVSWLHPWQGEVLFVAVAAAVLLGRERRPQGTIVFIPLLALVTPLLYYLVLSRTDESWRLAQEVNTGGGRLEVWTIAVALAPLALPALAGLRARWSRLDERLLVLWPAAMLAVYATLPQFPEHALEGISIPLGVLAMRGLVRVRHRAAWGGLLVALLVVPGTVHALRAMRDVVYADTQPFYLEPGEEQALAYLERARESGAVLSTVYLGSLVPARTGRQTWVAHPTWTRDFNARVAATEALFAGRVSPADARALVRRSRARFILERCGHPADALSRLRPLVQLVRRFGCARVHRVEGPLVGTGQTAQSADSLPCSAWSGWGRCGRRGASRRIPART